MSLIREELLSAAQTSCEAFASQKPLDEILRLFTASDGKIVEHGLQALTPFTGRSFIATEGIKQYFTIIADLLLYENMRFSDYVVDSEVSKVSVRGQAKFTWKSTGNSWQEVFTYTLEFDNEKKVKVYEVWADTGAAYMVSKGESHE